MVLRNFLMQRSRKNENEFLLHISNRKNYYENNDEANLGEINVHQIGWLVLSFPVHVLVSFSRVGAIVCTIFPPIGTNASGLQRGTLNTFEVQNSNGQTKKSVNRRKRHVLEDAHQWWWATKTDSDMNTLLIDLGLLWFKMDAFFTWHMPHTLFFNINLKVHGHKQRDPMATWTGSL